MLENKLKTYCKQLGFDLVGIIEPASLKKRLPILKKRKAQGLLCSFANQDTLLRVTPERLLPGIKAILVLGLGYNTKAAGNAPANSLTVAKYARGKDYHQVFKQKMNQVVRYLKNEAEGFEYRMFVDSSPLPERFLAELTGQGWVGQNTCFYTRATGSWIFLGEILLTLKLRTDEVADASLTCHGCGSCILACPTGALLGDCTLDPSKCLAYLTQARGVIPPKYRKLMGLTIIGCDICQEVCPDNHNVPEKKASSFTSSLKLPEIDAQEMLQLSNRQFKERYKDAAFAWCGKKVLQRNTMVALGNRGNKEDAVLIIPFLDHPDPVLRVHASWSLEAIMTAGK